MFSVFTDVQLLESIHVFTVYKKYINMLLVIFVYGRNGIYYCLLYDASFLIKTIIPSVRLIVTKVIRTGAHIIYYFNYRITHTNSQTVIDTTTIQKKFVSTYIIYVQTETDLREYEPCTYCRLGFSRRRQKSSTFPVRRQTTYYYFFLSKIKH